MATYKVVFNGVTREARVVAGAAATPGGFVSWGTFVEEDSPTTHDSTATYHAVRDLAYKAGEQNMQSIRITMGGVNIPAPAT